LTWLTNHRPSVLWHYWLGHLTRKIVSEMTYNVSSGMLNPTILYCYLLRCSNWLDVASCCSHTVWWYRELQILNGGVYNVKKHFNNVMFLDHKFFVKVLCCVAAVCEAVKAVCEFSHQLSDTIVFGFATSHTASIEAGEGMQMSCMLFTQNAHYRLHVNSFCKQLLVAQCFSLQKKESTLALCC